MRLAFAALVAGLVMGACQAPPEIAGPNVPDMKALEWIGSATDPVEHLLQQPAACTGPLQSDAVRRGDLLFNSPLLLGGQAAKAGLSCASCHRNGRGNPDFVFRGISGAAGTADVTNGLFSKKRADGVFNPVPIPDLATADGHVQVDRRRPGELEAFLTAQIIEEFSGQPPNSNVVSDLAAYIREIDGKNCPAAAREPQRWDTEIERLDTGLLALKTVDEENALPYRNASRAALRRLHERLPEANHVKLRDTLEAISRDIGAEGPVNINDARLNALVHGMRGAAPYSFYDPKVLAERFNQ